MLVSFASVSFGRECSLSSWLERRVQANNTSDGMNMSDRSFPSVNGKEFDAVELMISVVFDATCYTSMWRTRMDKYK